MKQKLGMGMVGSVVNGRFSKNEEKRELGVWRDDSEAGSKGYEELSEYLILVEGLGMSNYINSNYG